MPIRWDSNLGHKPIQPAQKIDPTTCNAVFLDFFGTVADGDRHAVMSVCDSVVAECRLSIEPIQFYEAWGRVFFELMSKSNGKHFLSLYDCEVLSLKDTVAQFDEPSNEFDAARYADELKQYWCNPPIHPDAKSAIEKIPVPVCCVSNADHQDLLSAIDRNGLAFDEIVSSEQTRSYKPDPRIFETALHRLNAAADQAWHVGDSLFSDIQGAQQMGIRAIWIERHTRIGDYGTAIPDHRIESLTELADLFT